MTGSQFSWPRRPEPDDPKFGAHELERVLLGGAVGSHDEFRARPIDWMEKMLGVQRETLQWSLNGGYAQHRWDGTPDPFLAASEAVAQGRDVGIESGTGTGKTFWLAATVLWFLACFRDAIVVTAAPKRDQLLLHVWKEIGRMWPRFRHHFPDASLTAGKARMLSGVDERERWTATAFVCGVGADEHSATKAQGFHAEFMLIITEETPGIHPAIMTAFANTRTDVHNLQISVGNPDHQRDELHKFCLRPGTEHIRVSALDHPNVVCGRTIVPGAVSQKSVEARREEYGDDHRLYRSRVRGISPAEAPDALIRREWCMEAVARYSDMALRTGEPALGVDVANSEDGDKGAIARWLGRA